MLFIATLCAAFPFFALWVEYPIWFDSHHVLVKLKKVSIQETSEIVPSAGNGVANVQCYLVTITLSSIADEQREIGTDHQVFCDPRRIKMIVEAMKHKGALDAFELRRPDSRIIVMDWFNSSKVRIYVWLSLILFVVGGWAAGTRLGVIPAVRS